MAFLLWRLFEMNVEPAEAFTPEVPVEAEPVRRGGKRLGLEPAAPILAVPLIGNERGFLENFQVS
jgi:hypothetical protein